MKLFEYEMAEDLFIELARIVRGVQEGRVVDSSEFAQRLRDYVGQKGTSASREEKGTSASRESKTSTRTSASREEKGTSASRESKTSTVSKVKKSTVPECLELPYNTPGFVLYKEEDKYIAEYTRDIKGLSYEVGSTVGYILGKYEVEDAAFSNASLDVLVNGVLQRVNNGEYVKCATSGLAEKPSLILDLDLVADIQDVNELLDLDMSSAQELLDYLNKRSTKRDDIIAYIKKVKGRGFDAAVYRPILKQQIIEELAKELLAKVTA